jgi:SAM-dependent methyltransferase
MERTAVPNRPFPEESFELLQTVEDSSFWFRARNRLLVWAIGAHFPQARSFLEVGCGTGYVLQGLAASPLELELTGVELFPAGLDVARRRVPRATLVEGDARELAFDAAFDVVGAFDVIEHVDEDEAVLAALHRAARPGGGVVITVPQHSWLWSAVDEYGGHRRRYSRGELVEKLERAGFVVDRTTSFVSLLLPLLAVSRFRQRNLPVESLDPVAEFGAPRVVDALLDRVMAVEQALVRRGISLPAGGSLLAVGHKPA